MAELSNKLIAIDKLMFIHNRRLYEVTTRATENNTQQIENL